MKITVDNYTWMCYDDADISFDSALVIPSACNDYQIQSIYGC